MVAIGPEPEPERNPARGFLPLAAPCGATIPRETRKPCSGPPLRYGRGRKRPRCCFVSVSGKRIAARPRWSRTRALTRRPAMTRHIHTSAASDVEAAHACSTAQVLDELQLYGFHPGHDEPDSRPLPEPPALEATVAALFETLAEPLIDTRLEPDLPDLLWSLTDLFHRKAARVQRQLDDNEDRQRRSQTEQDGSEIRSVELERLIAQGNTLIERRNAFEMLRDRAAEHYEAHTGSAWRPRAGSMVTHKQLTAATTDSRDFNAAKPKASTEVHLPAGPKIAFGGGVDCNDHHAIWAALDKVHAKHASMVLIHGGSPRGAELIAARWADHRKVTQIAFKPDWTREGKAAPFKRNDRMLDVLPIGLVVFPGSGITDNLADKAKKLGIKLFDFRKRGA